MLRMLLCRVVRFSCVMWTSLTWESVRWDYWEPLSLYTSTTLTTAGRILYSRTSLPQSRVYLCIKGIVSKGCYCRWQLGYCHVSFSFSVLCGPVSSSVFVDNCRNCTFVVACQQVYRLPIYLFWRKCINSSWEFTPQWDQCSTSTSPARLSLKTADSCNLHRTTSPTPSCRHSFRWNTYSETNVPYST